MLRGGSWINEARNLRSANRNDNDPGNRNDNIGLRVAPARMGSEVLPDQSRIPSVPVLPVRRKAPAPRCAGRPCADSPSGRRLVLPTVNVTFADSTFPPSFPPAWASAWGEDEFGIYAEIVVAEVAQRCRWMRPGKFLMGLPEGEEGWPESERPQHEVTLTGFWLADTACTQALWRAVMGENPSQFQDDLMNPVETVSWDDCAGFFAKLNALVPGLDAGFPSEAQWEYACRAGTVTAYSFGESITHEQVHFDQGWQKGKTVPVASLPANPWGLYEMHGNVWEWCSDWYGPYTAEPQTDPEGPAGGTGRVLRGGSWFHGARDLRSALRRGNDPGRRGDDIGLRVAPGRAGPAEPVGSGR